MSVLACAKTAVAASVMILALEAAVLAMAKSASSIRLREATSLVCTLVRLSLISCNRLINEPKLLRCADTASSAVFIKFMTFCAPKTVVMEVAALSLVIAPVILPSLPKSPMSTVTVWLASAPT